MIIIENMRLLNAHAAPVSWWQHNHHSTGQSVYPSRRALHQQPCLNLVELLVAVAQIGGPSYCQYVLDEDSLMQRHTRKVHGVDLQGE